MQARTWYRSWSSIVIYADSFRPSDCASLSRASYPCAVTCISLPNYSRHLDGTEWTHPWYSAQPRFLPAMLRSFELFPTADFFIFADDDTFLLKASLVRHLSMFDPRGPKAIGVKYCSWDSVSADVLPHRACHPFLQGGAGVILTNALLQTVAPHLAGCARRFNDPDFAGSMRFAICMERCVGADNWSEGKYIAEWPAGLHSSEPLAEFRKSQFPEAPASFHRMNASDFRWIEERIYVAWTWRGKDFRADLGLLPLVDVRVPIIRREFLVTWKVGMWITADALGRTWMAKGKWQARLDRRGRPVAYEQKYQGRILMRIVCDETVPHGRLFPREITGRGGVFEYSAFPPEVLCLSRDA